MPATFQQELAVYNANLIELLAYTGRFVMIRGQEIQGPFDTPEQARQAGRLRHGAAAFLVKQVHGGFGFASRAG
jgi:hypothetical protein